MSDLSKVFFDHVEQCPDCRKAAMLRFGGGTSEQIEKLRCDRGKKLAALALPFTQEDKKRPEALITIDRAVELLNNIQLIVAEGIDLEADNPRQSLLDIHKLLKEAKNET